MASLPQSRCSVSACPRGFTLLELLIAISITGLILVLAYGGLRLATSSWKNTSAVISNEEDLHLIYGFLRRQLAHTQLPAKLSATVIDKQFSGTAQQMSFVAPLPGRHAGASGLYRFNLVFAETDSGQQLEIDYVPDLPNAEPTTRMRETRKRVLLDRLASGAFSFFGKTTPTEQADWQESWDNQDTLPLLVKIQLNIKDQPVAWPEMIIPLYTGSAVP